MQSCFHKTGFWMTLVFWALIQHTLFAQLNSSAAPPSAVLTLLGPDTLCAGDQDTLMITFSDATAPFTFIYSINGLALPPVTTSENPYIFLTPFLSSGPKQIRLDSVFADGQNGTVSGEFTITVLPAPAASLVSDTVSICLGATDSLTLQFSGPGPYTFQYATANDTFPPVTTSDMLYKVPVSPGLGFTNYSLISVSSGSCDGAFNGNYGVWVGSPPTATLSGDTVICSGATVPLNVSFTGTPPWVIRYNANGVPQTPDTTVFNPMALLVSPTVPTFYQLTGVSSNGCAGTVSGQAIVNVQPALTATISGGGQICQGGAGTTITFTFSGPGPYTFVYQAGPTVQPPITTSTNPFILPVNPPNGTIYRLVSVTNGLCNGMISGTAIVAVFTPSTASLTGDLTLCNSADTTLMVDFTGSGPFELVYSVNGVTQPLVATFDDPYFIPVNLTSSATYQLISVESPGCVGMVNGSATVTVNYPPSYTNLTFNCDTLAGTYTLEFDVLGATLPLTLVSGTGAFGGPNGTHFVSAPIPIVQDYSIIFHDANDCGDIEVGGISGCNCDTEAGTMDLTPLTACANDTAFALHNGNQFLDSNDSLRFILHINPAQPLGQILAWSATPVFGFGPGMQSNITYYISAIAGDPDGNGNIDLNDPCLSVSQGVPVVFYSVPQATFDTLAPVCPGNNALVKVSLTGAPPFSLLYAIDGVAQPPVSNITTAQTTLNIPVTGPATLTLQAVSDLRCAAVNTDTLQIPIIPAPQVSNVTIACDPDTYTYMLEFDVTGPAPYNVSGVTGFFNGSHFISLPMPADQPYAVTVTDANNCGQATLSGVSGCTCPTNAGNMDLTPLTGCTADPVTAVHQNDAALGTGDVLVFVLHTSPGPGLGTILATQAQPVFNFQPGVTTVGTTYYISAVAGNSDGSGGVLLNDPCLSVSAGVPVVWRQSPTATFDANFDICAGGQVLIPVTFTGQAPFTLTYTSNGQQNTVVATQNSFTISATLITSTVFQAVSVSNAQCPGTATGQASATVHPKPDITNIDVVCAPDNLSYTIVFDVQNADFSSVTVSGSTTGSFNPSTGTFTSNPIPVQTGFFFSATDAWMCGLDSISGGASCSCTTSAGIMDQTPRVLCAADTIFSALATGFFLAPGDTLVYALVSSPSPTTWTVVALNNVPAFGFNPANMSPNTSYFLVALAGNILPSGIDLDDPCLSFALGSMVRWQPQPTVFLGADTDLCAGDSTQLSVLLSGNSPYTFTYQIDGVSQPAINTNLASYSLQVGPGSTTVYTLESGIANGCPATVSGSATISVFPKPQILNAITICDLATETYTLQFQVGNGPAANGPYTVSGVGGTFSDTTFTSAPIPSGQAYTVTVSTPEGCFASISGSSVCACVTEAGSIGPLGPLTICLPDVAVVQPDNNAVLEPGDGLQYILYQDPSLLPQGILATSGTPQLAFQPGMTLGTTYYISAVAGDLLPDGSLDLNDPCLSVSNAVPVVFRPSPTAALSGDTTVCVGSNVLFRIQFTGTAPFKFVYAINGSQQTAISAPQNMFTVSTNNIQQTQVFSLVSVQDAFCTGTVSGAYTVNVQQGPTASLLSNTTICRGDSATLRLQLGGASVFDVTINGGASPIQLTGVSNGATFSVAPPASSTYTIGSVVAQGNSCPPNLGPGVTVTIAPPVTTAATLSDYGGFNVSCPAETDGSIVLSPAGGIPPVSALWSTGGSGLNQQNLAAGTYSVTLTDNIGCVYRDSFVLTGPENLSLDAATQDPACRDDRNGALILQAATGGAGGPYTLSLNGMPAQVIGALPAQVPNLGAGDYTLTLADINGCETTLALTLNNPPPLTIDLGPDAIIAPGDSVLLELLTTAAIDSFAWTPATGLSSPGSLATYAQPAQTIVYTLWVQDTSGCTAEDQIQVIVQNLKRVYVPNAIRPGAGNGNGVLAVYAGPEVQRIPSFRIYNRWGECVFERLDVQPNLPNQGWDGQWRGKDVPPGVYVYVLELEYTDQTTEVKSGEVTVVR